MLSLSPGSLKGEKLTDILTARVFWQVNIIDGRQVTGNLVCIDKQQNLVLQHSTQSYSSTSDPSGDRQLGTVIVPRQQRKSCQVEVG